MKIKIFYSWQSDTAAEFNRIFIEEALEEAIKKLSKDPMYEFHDFLIDRDTKNVPGTPSIPDTVQEKIEECNIFLADLTVINYAENKKNLKLNRLQKFILGEELNKRLFNVKQNLNPNVVFELGLAFTNLQPERIICVMNSFYGEPTKEGFPFDLVQKSWPIQYNFSDNNKNEKGKILEEFSERLTIAIRESIDFGITNPILKLYPFLEWEQWTKEFKRDTDIEYFTTPAFIDHIGTINNLANIETNILRIVGLSGLGKTRLVYESFNPQGILKKNEEFKKILYLNLNTCESDYLKVIKQLAEGGQRRILIIDNCDFTKHNNLISIIKQPGCKLSLITIDFNPIEKLVERSSEFSLIQLSPDDCEDVIDQILLKFFPQQNEQEERETIKRFARGHTLIATLLASSKRSSPKDWIPIINKPDVIDKLLGEEGKSTEMRHMLVAISIFEKIGFYDELKNQSEFVATNKLITGLDFSREVSIMKFNETCLHFLRRGLIDKQARYIMIRTKPLALTLAIEWWQSCTPDHAKAVLASLQEHQGLKEALCDQLKYLDFLENAKEIVKDLCGQEGPFGNAEVLNTDEGSRLFRSLVEVNPQDTSDALFRIFGSMKKEDLLQVKAGRRNLVWALEKLCFRRETFEKAVKVLMAFGIAETETHISNNSRGQFFHLFQIHLPGTEASLEDRISIIEFALSTHSHDYEDMAIGALLRAIQTHDFSRMGGAEKQGSSTQLSDYYPPFKEISHYWKYSLQKLIEIANKDQEKRERIIPQIINSIRGFYSARCGHIILPFIQNIIQENQDAWFDIRTNFKMTLKYEDSSLTSEDKETIKELITGLEPTDFVTKYKNYVKKSYWDFSEDSTSLTDLANSRAFKLAEEFIHKNLSWDEFMPLFFDGEQHLGYWFGRKIGEFINSDGKNDVFITNALRVIKSIPADKRNVIVLTGFLSIQTDQDFVLRVIKEIINDDELYIYSFYIAYMINPRFDVFMALFDLVENGKVKITEFNRFQYGHSLNNLSNEELNQFANTLMDNYGKVGSQIALLILYGYSFSDENKWFQVRDLIRKSIMTKDLIKVEEDEFLDKYFWSESILKILRQSKDPELVQFINKEIIELCGVLDFLGNLDSDFKKLLQVFLDDYFDLIWPDLSKALLSDTEHYMSYYNLKIVLGAHIGSLGNDIGILFQNEKNFDKIFDWALSNREIAPIRLAGMVPIFDYEEIKRIKQTWHPFTRRLIDEFGNEEGFTDELNANMRTYSWTGSVVPLLRAEKAIIEQLVSHNLEKVRNWANRKLQYIDEAIRQESNFDVEIHL